MTTSKVHFRAVGRAENGVFSRGIGGLFYASVLSPAGRDDENKLVSTYGLLHIPITPQAPGMTQPASNLQ